MTVSVPKYTILFVDMIASKEVKLLNIFIKCDSSVLEGTRNLKFYIVITYINALQKEFL